MSSSRAQRDLLNDPALCRRDRDTGCQLPQPHCSHPRAFSSTGIPPAAPSPAPVCVSTRQPLFALPQAMAALLQGKQFQVPSEMRNQTGISQSRNQLPKVFLATARLCSAAHCTLQPLESGLRSTTPGCHISHVEHRSLPTWLLLPPGRALCDPNLDVPHISSLLHRSSQNPRIQVRTSDAHRSEHGEDICSQISPCNTARNPGAAATISSFVSLYI